MQQQNQKEIEHDKHLMSPGDKGDTTTAGQASDPVTKNRASDATGAGSIQKQSSSVSQRPSRKAKTKEAVLKHLNRDAGLWVEDKQEKKPSVKKEKPQSTPSVTVNPAGSKYR